MNRNCSKNVRARSVLAVLVVGVLGLAASPAALAKDRGGPGQPGAQQQRGSDKKPVLPRKLRPGRSVSWSD
jgi:hypothetical protein